MIKVILIDLDHTFWEFNSFDSEKKNLEQLKQSLYAESIECVHLLKNKGYKVGFASASYNKDLCVEYLKMLFPVDYIDFIFIEATFPTKKKHYEYVSLRFGVEFSEMLMIDDTREILLDASIHGLNIIDAGEKGLTKKIIKHIL